MIDAFLPPDLAPNIAVLLIGASLLTSALTAAFGIGGGVTLLALMAPVLPAQVLIPIHGLIQLGSNAGRAAILARHADYVLIGWFLVGALVGVIVGAAVVVDLPESVLRIAIGVFVIFSALAKVPAIAGGGRVSVTIGGVVSTILTMFLGATGPFVIALFKQFDMARQRLVATTSVAMVIQHGLKILAFGFLGFAFSAWLGLVAAMIVSGFIGTVLGTRLLKRLPETGFRTVLTLILVALGLNLVIGEVVSLLRAG